MPCGNNYPKIPCVLILLFLGQFYFLSAQPYGIDFPSAVGKFLNDSLPNQTPTGETVDEWEVINAFPNLTFNDPLDLRELPGNELLVVSKNGKMWTFDNDPNASTKNLFLDISDRIMTTDKGNVGVFGAILHPEYGQANSPNQFIYVVYRHFHAAIENRGYARLSRFTISNGIADPNSEFILINQFDGHDWHNGGSMFFGPQDGFLYLSIGDEGSNNDQFNSAQTLEKGFFSGILRIDVDRRGGAISHPIRRQPSYARTPPSGWPESYSQGYYIPNDNPWLSPDSSHLEEFYAIGFRSCHRMYYDEPTGDIWIGDVGQASREEVTIIRKGDNAQWPYKEGLIDGAKPQPTTIIGNEKPPLFDMDRNEAHAVMGGIVYRGGKWSSSFEGKYIFATHKFQTINSVDYYNSGSTDRTILTTIPFLTSEPIDGPVHIYKDQVGEIFILQLMGDKTEGLIYKLNPKTTTPVINAPLLLSETGAFSDLSTLSPSTGLVPFEPNVTFWSDGASKKRWVALPNDGSHDSAEEQILFSEEGEWTFPNGTVFVKHFDLLMDEEDPNSAKKIETRFTVKGDDGQIYFLTYRWREDESDADLVLGGADRSLTIQTSSGSRQQIWHYPTNNECLTCHNSGGALGVNTRQMNGDYPYDGGVTDNQLRTMNHLNWFSSALNEGNIPSYMRVSPISDANASLEEKALSYLDVNCAYCHRPGNLQVNMDLRFPTPLDQKNILHVDPEDDLGITGAKRVFQGDHSQSIVFHRMSSLQSDVMMPPLSKFLVDQEGTNLIRDWINSLDPFADEEPPSIPSGLSATNIQSSELTLTWEESSDNVGVSGYQIFQDGNVIPIDTANGLSYTVTGLQPETIYFFAVAAMDTSGNISNQSSTIQVQTTAIDPCLGQAAVTIDPAGPFMSDQGVQQLTANPSGGTWSGSANSDGTFDPGQGAGTYQVIYTVDFGNGCTKADTIEIDVQAPADPCAGQAAVSIDPAGPFTTDQGVQQLTANPSGGTWSGSANSDGTFDPGQGAGTYQVIYTVDFGNGCTKADTIEVEVQAPADPCAGQAAVSIDPAGPFTTDQGVQQLTANPSGGTWSGSADSDGTFDPGQGAGTYQVIYTVDFGNGCTKADTIEVEVQAPADPCAGQAAVSIDPAGPFTTDQGVQQLTANPSGGTWSGSADSDGTFDPGQGTGLYEIIYTVDFGNGCTKADTIEVEVQAPADSCAGQAAVSIDPAGPFTTDQGVQQLTANPSGGTWSGSADSDGTFDPGQGTGLYEIIYTVDFGNGCTKADTIEVEVQAPADPCAGQAAVSIDPAGPFTTDQGVQQLTANPSGGTWSGSADSDGTFDPGQGTGLYEIIYTVDFGNGCTKADTFEIEVQESSTGGECNSPINLALGQATQQSSTRGNGVSSIAVDGDTEGTGNNWGSNPKITHTQTEVEPWWEVDLGQEADIEQVNIYNRTSCCINRLKDFYVLVSSQPFGNSSLNDLLNSPNVQSTFYTGQAGTLANIPFVVGGRYVRLQLTSANNPLHIAEVEVMGCPSDGSDPCQGQPNVTIDPVGPFTTDQGIQQLTANPTGGTWSGSANTDGSFDPSQGAGTYTVTYTVDFGGGCVQSTDANIEVRTPSDPCAGQPAVSVDPAGPFTTDQGIQQLSANPIGGTWSGSANSDGTFDPSQGPGTYTVTYSVDFGDGCIKSTEASITVTSPADPCAGQPAVVIDLVGPFTTDQGIQQLIANPSGGTWSGSTDASGTFDPSQGAGTYSVIYTVDFGNNCTKADTLDIEVQEPSTGGECTTPINLALGQATQQSSTRGNGVSSIAVDGDTEGTGNNWGSNPKITHTQNEIEPWWEVDLGQEADIEQVNIYNRTSCCVNRLKDFYVLVSSQPFGNSSLTDLLNSPNVQSTFFAGQAGTLANVPFVVGGRYVRLQLTSTNHPLHIAEVQVMAAQVMEVTCAGQPSVNIDPAGPFTTDQGIQQLSANPSGGSWSGAASADGAFDPSQGAGTYTVSYTVDFGGGCVKSTQSNITVTTPSDPCVGQPAVTIDPAGPFTTEQGIQQLSGNPSGGSWSGSVNIDGTFDPSQGAGVYSVSYTVDFGDGCVKSTQIDISVSNPSTGDCTVPYNLALNQPASQSSTNQQGVASFTNDGNIIGNDFTGADANMSHTVFGDNQPWWMVDLGSSATLDQTILYNRTGASSKQLSRLKNFYLYFSGGIIDGERSHSSLKNDAAIEWVHFPDELGTDETIQLNGVQARHVLVKLVGNGPLHIAEWEYMDVQTPFPIPVLPKQQKYLIFRWESREIRKCSLFPIPQMGKEALT